jgi:hypothetical protein
MSDLNEAAFARPRSEGTIKSSIGLTKREYAAIHLRVPMSGNPELDAMIRDAVRRELAARAMEALCVSIENNEKLCRICGEIADAMLKEDEK